MKRNLIILAIAFVLVIVGIFIFATRKVESPQDLDTENSSNDQTPQITLAGNDPETVGYSFVLDFIAAGTPETDTHEDQSAMRAYDALSAEAQNMVSVDNIELGLLEFLELTSIPDQGASVEDLQVDSQNASLIVGLNYSGGDRQIRSINMVNKDNAWKVDSVDVLEVYPLE